MIKTQTIFCDYREGNDPLKPVDSISALWKPPRENVPWTWIQQLYNNQIIRISKTVFSWLRLKFWSSFPISHVFWGNISIITKFTTSVREMMSEFSSLNYVPHVEGLIIFVGPLYCNWWLSYWNTKGLQTPQFHEIMKSLLNMIKLI
jgi:hypothetical protein